MSRWRWLAVVGGLIYCGVVSWSLQAAELCVSALADRPGAIPQPITEWDVMTSPVVEFQVSAGDECQWRVAIPKASRFTFQIERLNQQADDWGEYVIKVETIGRGGASRSLTAVNRSSSGDTHTYLAFEPGWYVVLVRVKQWDREKDPIRPHRLSFSSYEPLPMPIPALTQGVTFAIAANASENVRVLPFRMTERAFVRMRFASVCSPDLLTTRPLRYSVQELEECKRLRIEPDPSAGSRIRPFQVEVLDSWGRMLEPLWADFSQPPGVIKLKLHIGPEEPTQNHEELAVILPEGQYALGVKPSFYSGDMREDRQSGPLSMTATVAEFKPEPLPPATQALAAWLDATGLNEHFSVIDFYATNPPGTASCAARRDRRYQSVLFAVAKDRQVRSDGRASKDRTSKKDIELVRNLCDPRAKPVRVARPDVPTVLVDLSTTLHDGELEALEGHFYQRFGATLWDRMFLKISSSLRLPQKQIVMQVPPTLCWDGLIYWRNGRAGRSGDRCSYATSAHVSIPLSDLNLNLPNLANTAQSSIATGSQRIGQIIATFIENSYTTKGATVEFLERGNSSVEAIIRGLRGEVIRGGKDWDRMQVSVFALRGEKGTIQLRTLVDGRIASGLGRYPPDSIFTTDMEPRYSGAMTEYARRLLDGIQIELTKRGPNK